MKQWNTTKTVHLIREQTEEYTQSSSSKWKRGSPFAAWWVLSNSIDKTFSCCSSLLLFLLLLNCLLSFAEYMLTALGSGTVQSACTELTACFSFILTLPLHLPGPNENHKTVSGGNSWSVQWIEDARWIKFSELGAQSGTSKGRMQWNIHYNNDKK